MMTERKSIRAEIRKKRQALSACQQEEYAQQLVQQLINLSEVKNATKIAIYLANDGELDPMPFIKWCWGNKKEVYLPVLHPFTKGYLLFLRYEPTTKMYCNKFGIPEPNLNIQGICPLDELDIIFTPLVAFDLSGARMGMGGGFYDRTLSRWYHQSHACNNLSPSNNLIPIGLAHDCQQVSHISSENWDIPLPKIITPTQIVSAKKCSMRVNDQCY